jgi:hypothetical protein
MMLADDCKALVAMGAHRTLWKGFRVRYRWRRDESDNSPIIGRVRMLSWPFAGLQGNGWGRALPPSPQSEFRLPSAYPAW